MKAKTSLMIALVLFCFVCCLVQAGADFTACTVVVMDEPQISMFKQVLHSVGLSFSRDTTEYYFAQALPDPTGERILSFPLSKEEYQNALEGKISFHEFPEDRAVYAYISSNKYRVDTFWDEPERKGYSCAIFDVSYEEEGEPFWFFRQPMQYVEQLIAKLGLTTKAIDEDGTVFTQEGNMQFALLVKPNATEPLELELQLNGYPYRRIQFDYQDGMIQSTRIQDIISGIFSKEIPARNMRITFIPDVEMDSFSTTNLFPFTKNAYASDFRSGKSIDVRLSPTGEIMPLRKNATSEGDDIRVNPENSK